MGWNLVLWGGTEFGIVGLDGIGIVGLDGIGIVGWDGSWYCGMGRFFVLWDMVRCSVVRLGKTHTAYER